MDWGKYPRNIVNAVDVANIKIKAARYRWYDCDLAQMGVYGEREEPDFAGELDRAADDLRALREKATDRATRSLLTRTINRVAAERERVIERETNNAKTR
ncbi:MAG: hypothetical protein J6W10_04135 [Kiritimatiellae bacterium]|nr:hypothetical protein [Kiritimatiellia bacterium]